jgi:CRISPR-associated protein Csm5
MAQELFQTRTIRLQSPALFVGGPFATFGPGDIALVGDKAYLLDREAVARAALERGGPDAVARLSEALRSATPTAFADRLVGLCGGGWERRTTRDGRQLVYGTIGVGRLPKYADVNQSRPFVRDASGHAYIPGTSIKGALRTALLAALLGDAHLLAERVRSRGESFGRNAARDLDLESPLQRGFAHTIGDAERRQDAPQRDLLRAVRVGDSTPIPDERMILTSARVTFPPGSGVGDGAPVVAEYALDVDVTFSVTLDLPLLAAYSWPQVGRFETIDQMFAIAAPFYGSVWDEERAFQGGAAEAPPRSAPAFTTPEDYERELQRFAVERFGRPRDLEHLKELVRRARSEFEVEHGLPPFAQRPGPADVPAARHPASFYAAPKCPYQLRIGGGSGWLATTLGMLLDTETRFQVLRATSSTKRARQAGSFEPATRKMLEGLGTQLGLGWCSIEVMQAAR